LKSLKRLFGYVRFYKSQAALSIFLAFVVAGLASVQIPALFPIFQALFGDGNADRLRGYPDRLPQFLSFLKGPFQGLVEYLIAHRWEAFVWALGILLVLNLLKGFAAFFQSYIAGKVHTGVSRRLSVDLYDHVIGMPMSFYNRMGSPSIVSRFANDVESVARGLALLLGKSLVDPLLLVGFLASAAVINWKLLLLNIAIFPFVLVGVRKLGMRAKLAARKGLHNRDRLVNIIQETAEGVSIVKAFNMEDREKKRFWQESDNVRRQDLKIVKADSIVSPFVEFMGFMAVCVSLLVAGDMVIQKTMTMTTFSLFYVALASMFTPIRKLSSINNRVQVLVAAANRVFEVLDEKSDIVEKPGAARLAAFNREIRFDNVTFSYDGSEVVLHDVNLVARKGEIVALVGPSGAGKTTIARLIPRFYDPAAGSVTVDGIDIRDVTFESLRNQIGLVTQDVILFNDTIAANISYGRPSASKEEIMAAARAANAHDFIERLPEGYNSEIGEKGLTLSGGQRQRIALARAILKDPPILILDEATSSLDSESEFLIQQALDQFMRARTSIVIAHRLSTVERASRIYVVDSGRIVDAGSNEELLSKSLVYKNLYRRQFRLAEV